MMYRYPEFDRQYVEDLFEIVIKSRPSLLTPDFQLLPPDPDSLTFIRNRCYFFQKKD